MTFSVQGMILNYHEKSNAYEVAKEGGDEPFYVVGSDPYWTVVPENIGDSVYATRRTKPQRMLSLKVPELQNAEEIKYRVVGDQMQDLNGHPLSPKGESSGKPNVVSFVVTQAHELKIGYGHTALSKGHTVIMAGTLHIKDGVATYYGNESGHSHRSNRSPCGAGATRPRHRPAVGCFGRQDRPAIRQI